jgi:hypothetical protein
MPFTTNGVKNKGFKPDIAFLATGAGRKTIFPGDRL